MNNKWKFFPVILLVFLVCWAQSYAQNENLIGKGDFDFKSQTYQWKFKKSDQGNLDFTLAKNSDLASGKTFSLVELKFETFRTSFINTITEFYNGGNAAFAFSPTETNALNNEVGKVFLSAYQALTGINPNTPPAGQISFKNTIAAYLHDKKKPIGYITIDSIEVEFYRGNIENIYVQGVLTDTSKSPDIQTPITFNNFYPVGFSTFRDYRILSTHIIYENIPGAAHSIKLTDLFSYIPRLGLNLKDYSPLDTVITFKPQNVGRVVLPKEHVSRILTARVYSDFVGLDAEEPNGLIQVEVSRRVILMNRKRPFPWWNRPLVVFGVGAYVEPVLVLSKLEENKKFLPVISRDVISGADSNAAGTLSGRNLVNNLDLIRYENFSFGADLNIATMDVELLKSTFYLNFGARLARTSMIDSLKIIDNGEIKYAGKTETFTINYLRYFPEVVWQVKPDTRFGFFASWRVTHMSLYDDRVEQIYNYKRFMDPSKEEAEKNIRGDNWVSTIQFTAFLSPNKNGDFFFRYAYSNHLFDRNRNFAQVQLGYTFNVLKKR